MYMELNATTHCCIHFIFTSVNIVSADIYAEYLSKKCCIVVQKVNKTMNKNEKNLDME